MKKETKQRKKRKNKRIRRPGRLLYLLFLAGATALVSLRGGNISYLLFYFALALPILAFLYSLYVFYRFKIVQEVSRVVEIGRASCRERVFATV